jgi:hypothetical protein
LLLFSKRSAFLLYKSHSKRFFFEKKNQKTFARLLLRRRAAAKGVQTDKAPAGEGEGYLRSRQACHHLIAKTGPREGLASPARPKPWSGNTSKIKLSRPVSSYIKVTLTAR